MRSIKTEIVIEAPIEKVWDILKPGGFFLLMTGDRTSLKAIREGGFNTFLLNTKDIFLDMLTDSEELMLTMRDLIPLYEGFMTYGGMSVREIEAMAVGLRETLDETVIGQSPSFIEYAVNELDSLGIPVVMPAGALACHMDALQFLPHVDQLEYSAGALAAALYIISGSRGMERGPFPWTGMQMVTMSLPTWNC